MVPSICWDKLAGTTRYATRCKLKFDELACSEYDRANSEQLGEEAQRASTAGSQPVNHFNLQSVSTARRNMFERAVPQNLDQRSNEDDKRAILL